MPAREFHAQPVEGKRLLEKGAKSARFCQQDVSKQATGSSSAAQTPGGPGNPGCCPFKMWGQKDTNEEPAEN